MGKFRSACDNREAGTDTELQWVQVRAWLMLQCVMGSRARATELLRRREWRRTCSGETQPTSPVAELVLEDVGGLLLHVPELNSVEPLGKKEGNLFILKHSLASLLLLKSMAGVQQHRDRSRGK